MGDIVIPIELIDGRRLRAFKNALKAAIDALPKIEKQVNNEYKQRVKQGLEDIAEEAIDMFYESYSPHMYHRTNDLYNTYKVIVTDDRWAIDLSPSFMDGSHRVSSEYIYNYMFKEGYHGGAIDGPEHPDPGVPWYRSGPTPFSFWWWARPAVQTESPYNKMVADYNNYIDEVIEERDNELVQRAQPYIDRVEQAFSNLI